VIRPWLVAVLLLCVSCQKGTPNNPILPAGATLTPLPQPAYVGIGKYQKLDEVTVGVAFGGVPLVTFVEIRQASGVSVPHEDVPGYVYELKGTQTISRDDGERGKTVVEGAVGWAETGSQHENPTDSDLIWYFVAARPITQRGAALPFPNYRMLYESPDLQTPTQGKLLVQQIGLITMAPGGRTSSHSHGGTETFYVLQGAIELATNDGKRTTVSAGQGASIKPGVVMQLRVTGADPVKILTLFVTPEGEPWQTNLETLP
jgi:quercetin dioxygenase-like cupin family protein